MKRTFLAALFFCSAVLLGAVTPSGNHESVLGIDQRTAVDFKRDGGKFIGLLGGMLCTANLVGEAHILTAGHCLRDGVFPVFYFQKNGVTVTRTVTVTKTYRPAANQDIGVSDWVIAEVSEELGTEFGFLPVASQKYRPPFETNLAGYSSDRELGEKPTTHRECEVIAFDSEGHYEHVCDTNHGASGGALLTYLDNRFHVVGVHTKNEFGLKNFAVPSSFFFKTVEAAREDFKKRKLSGAWKPVRIQREFVDRLSDTVTENVVIFLRVEYGTHLSEKEVSSISQLISRELKKSNAAKTLEELRPTVGDEAILKLFNYAAMRPMLEEMAKSLESDGLLRKRR